MSLPFLAAKTRLPTSLPDLVACPQSGAQLTLVAAPAGAGKTTLLAQSQPPNETVEKPFLLWVKRPDTARPARLGHKTWSRGIKLPRWELLQRPKNADFPDISTCQSAPGRHQSSSANGED